MTENSEEIAQLKRAHTALGSKVDAVLPTLATKPDLEAMARHLTEEMARRFGAMSLRFDTKFEELNRRMSEGFDHIWRWLAGSLVTLIIALLGLLAAVLFRRPYVLPPAAPAQPAVVNHFYPEMTARQPVAPPPQP